MANREQVKLQLIQQLKANEEMKNQGGGGGGDEESEDKDKDFEEQAEKILEEMLKKLIPSNMMGKKNY